MKKTAIILSIAFCALFAQASFNEWYAFKNVKGYHGKGNVRDNGFIVNVVDYTLPENFPSSDIYLSTKSTNGDKIIGVYFQGLPETPYFVCGIAINRVLYEGDLYQQTLSPFPFARQLGFNPDQTWTGTPITGWDVDYEWWYGSDENQLPLNPFVQMGLIRIGILVQSIDGTISAYLNEQFTTVVP